MERNVPKLRFNGFNDEWELSNLKKLCDINPKSKELPDKFLYIDLESIVDGVLIKKNIIELKDAPSRAQRLLNVGDVLFQTVRPYQMNNYLFEYEFNYKSVASTGYAQLRCKNYISNNKFIYQVLHNKKFNNKVMLRCTGTSYPAINSSELVTIPLRIPSLQEQERIANFLTKVDKIIEKQEEKVKNLENYKKGMMQKIFSQEIRFKDENGEVYPEWEERRLGDFIIEYTEKTTENNQYEPLTSSRKGLFLQSEYFNKQIASEDNTGYNIVPKGYFTYRHMSDDSIFYFNINDIIDFGIVSTLYPVFTVNEGMNSRFLRYYLNEGYDFKKYCLLQKQGGSRTYMYLNKLKGFRGKFPVIMEQNKIAKFLLDIDSLVNKEKEKLEELKQWKKGLLQQMFI